MTRKQFAAHVEHVFRYHNEVMNELITHADELPAERNDADALRTAEENMDMACAPLNEIASAEIMAESASFWTKRKLPRAVPACEAATHHLEGLLQEAFKTKKKRNPG